MYASDPLRDPLNADPSDVGGRGQSAASFVYPLLTKFINQSTVRQFNYRDTLNLSWVTWAENNSAVTLQLYYHFGATGDFYPYGEADIVKANGSKVVRLDGVQTQGFSWYLGQWNLNFTRTDNSPTTGITLSQVFNCSFSDDEPPTDYFGLNFTGTPITSVDSVSTATVTDINPISTVTVTSMTSMSTVMATKASSSLSNSNFQSASGGAIAGITLGLLAASGIGAFAAILLIRGRKKRSGHSKLESKGLEKRASTSAQSIPQYSPRELFAEGPGAGSFELDSHHSRTELPHNSGVRRGLVGKFLGK